MLMLAAMLAAGLPLAALAQVARNVDGTVTRVDMAAEKMSIRHGPIKEFDMDDGMTMVFRVKEAAMLKAVKAGDKVKFDVEKAQGLFTIIKIQKTK
jgi:Cu/Ag efflux protein CusF